MVDLERPEGVIVQFGGQTPLKLARGLTEAGVPLRFDDLYTVESLAGELSSLLLGCADGSSGISRQTGSSAPAREEGC